MAVLNINEAIVQIKAVGATNVRSVPMPGQTINGQHQVEIRKDAVWTPIVVGLAKHIAEGIIAQATNRTICG